MQEASMLFLLWCRTIKRWLRRCATQGKTMPYKSSFFTIYNAAGHLRLGGWFFLFFRLLLSNSVFECVSLLVRLRQEKKTNETIQSHV